MVSFNTGEAYLGFFAKLVAHLYVVIFLLVIAGVIAYSAAQVLFSRNIIAALLVVPLLLGIAGVFAARAVGYWRTRAVPDLVSEKRVSTDNIIELINKAYRENRIQAVPEVVKSFGRFVRKGMRIYCGKVDGETAVSLSASLNLLLSVAIYERNEEALDAVRKLVEKTFEWMRSGCREKEEIIGFTDSLLDKVDQNRFSSRTPL